MRDKRNVLSIIPYLVLLAYSFLIVDYFRFLNIDLSYKLPKLPSAPEDILGFGFYPYWIFFLIVTALSVLTLKKYLSRNSIVIIVVLFTVLSIIDYSLNSIIMRYVFAAT